MWGFPKGRRDSGLSGAGGEQPFSSRPAPQGGHTHFCLIGKIHPADDPMDSREYGENSPVSMTRKHRHGVGGPVVLGVRPLQGIHPEMVPDLKAYA